MWKKPNVWFFNQYICLYNPWFNHDLLWEDTTFRSGPQSSGLGGGSQSSFCTSIDLKHESYHSSLVVSLIGDTQYVPWLSRGCPLHGASTWIPGGSTGTLLSAPTGRRWLLLSWPTGLAWPRDAGGRRSCHLESDVFECQSQLCLLSTVRSWDSRPCFAVPPLWSVENHDGPCLLPGFWKPAVNRWQADPLPHRNVPYWCQ